jgi:hypothetical protein
VADAVFIPVEAVHSDDRGTFAWVTSTFGSPRARRIVVGKTTRHFAQVREGLRVGERVRIGEAE